MGGLARDSRDTVGPGKPPLYPDEEWRSDDME